MKSAGEGCWDEEGAGGGGHTRIAPVNASVNKITLGLWYLNTYHLEEYVVL